MASKRIARITRNTMLTNEDAAEVRRLRELAENDKEELVALGRSLLAEKRRRQAERRGVSTLGQTIRAAREAQGFTQAELASRAKVAQAYLSYLEQDQREPSLSIAARIARELAIPLEDLASAVGAASTS